MSLASALPGDPRAARPDEESPASIAAVGAESPDPVDGRSMLLLTDPALALRSARELAEQGEGPTALDLLAATARQHPLVADYADLLRARLIFEQDENAQAADASLAALEAHPKSPLRPEFYSILGSARAEIGDEIGARAAWKAALDETSREERRAALRLELAQSFERDAYLAEAVDVYRTLWMRHGTLEEAEIATARLSVLEAKKGALRRKASDWRRRGDHLFRKRRNELALAAYDEALAMGLPKRDVSRAQKQRAHTLFRMRDYSKAVEAFSALPQKDDVPIWRARSMARSGQVPEAIREFEALAKRSKGSIGVRATYLAALLLEGRDEKEKARRYFDKVSQSRDYDGLRNAATWRLGWSAYRGARHREAVRYFEHLIDGQEDPIGRLRTRYWRARSLEQLGDEAIGHEFAAMAREYPLSYYGWRARTRALDDGTQAPPIDVARGRDRLAPRELERVQILIGAGLEEQAVNEMRAISSRAGSLRDRLALAELFSEAGEYHRAQRLVVDAYTEPLARGPLPSLEELWWHAWPTAYGTLVRDWTRAPGSVEPALVFAIMREESGYRAEVVSPSGARGLLQIMIPTGTQLAARMGHAGFSADDLFDPSTNIKLGSHYLGELKQRFDGRLSASIASYNAGPEAVASWLGPGAPTEDDEWVESIPYDQTRGYVRRVMRSLHAYKVLY
ncbi:MAG: transglycosylase SLT domain-containing protein [Deltaproteobacteria bacterium]|nr:transglycosylase SLT domain-containing protein [Deltaproteobacteria bacterium]MBW2420875.1 transglycosylase SLT domain-containing protein [Deltaproteobacteria bacterium]